jgi:hypothetical protein
LAEASEHEAQQRLASIEPAHQQLRAAEKEWVVTRAAMEAELEHHASGAQLSGEEAGGGSGGRNSRNGRNGQARSGTSAEAELLRAQLDEAEVSRARAVEAAGQRARSELRGMANQLAATQAQLDSTRGELAAALSAATHEQRQHAEAAEQQEQQEQQQERQRQRLAAVGGREAAAAAEMRRWAAMPFLLPRSVCLRGGVDWGITCAARALGHANRCRRKRAGSSSSSSSFRRS